MEKVVKYKKIVFSQCYKKIRKFTGKSPYFLRNTHAKIFCVFRNMEKFSYYRKFVLYNIEKIVLLKFLHKYEILGLRRKEF